MEKKILFIVICVYVCVALDVDIYGEEYHVHQVTGNPRETNILSLQIINDKIYL